MQKDLNYLKSKWWYRLLKILYILFFVLVVLITLLIHFNASSTPTTCQWGISSEGTCNLPSVAQWIEAGKPKPVKTNDSNQFTGQIILEKIFLVIIEIVIFEFIRRLFYYVILNSFFPEKQKKYLFFKIKSRD